MNIPLAIIYFGGIVQYITTHLQITSKFYSTNLSNINCHYNFLFQLTFWNGLLWFFYFTFFNNSNIFLFMVIIIQLSVTIGHIYQIKDIKKISDTYYNYLFHWVGFILGIFYYIRKLKYLNIKDFLFTFFIFLIYFLIVFLYTIISKKNHKDCNPEDNFNILKLSDRKLLVIFFIILFILSFILNKLLLLKK